MKLTKQQVKNRMAWIDALRSGEYTQDTISCQLRSAKSGGYCCMGVLCDVQAPNNWKHLADSTQKIHLWYHDLASQLPDSTYLNSVGVYTALDPDVDQRLTASRFNCSWPEMTTQDCANLNDIKKHTFDEIADALLIDLLERTKYYEKI